MLMKFIIVIIFLTILYSLASSFFYLVKEKGQGTGTVKRLTWRIALSIVLFLFLWVAFQMGWIKPSGGPIARMPEQTQTSE